MRRSRAINYLRRACAAAGVITGATAAAYLCYELLSWRRFHAAVARVQAQLDVPALDTDEVRGRLWRYRAMLQSLRVLGPSAINNIVAVLEESSFEDVRDVQEVSDGDADAMAVAAAMYAPSQLNHVPTNERAKLRSELRSLIQEAAMANTRSGETLAGRAFVHPTAGVSPLLPTTDRSTYKPIVLRWFMDLVVRRQEERLMQQGFVRHRSRCGTLWVRSGFAGDADAPATVLVPGLAGVLFLERYVAHFPVADVIYLCDSFQLNTRLSCDAMRHVASHSLDALAADLRDGLRAIGVTAPLRDTHIVGHSAGAILAYVSRTRAPPCTPAAPGTHAIHDTDDTDACPPGRGRTVLLDPVSLTYHLSSACNIRKGVRPVTRGSQRAPQPITWTTKGLRKALVEFASDHLVFNDVNVMLLVQRQLTPTQALWLPDGTVPDFVVGGKTLLFLGGEDSVSDNRYAIAMLQSPEHQFPCYRETTVLYDDHARHGDVACSRRSSMRAMRRRITKFLRTGDAATAH